MSKFFSNSDIVLFLGDSITDCGRDRSELSSLGSGYPAIIKAVYNTLFPSSTSTFINKGISGERVRNLLERYDRDVFEVQPTFISILIGINDVWRAFDNNDPCPLERFRDEYTRLLEKIKADFSTVKIMLIEPFVLHNPPDRATWHSDLDPKREFVRELAEAYADYWLPLQSIFNKKCETEFTELELAYDGVHPETAGHAVIAAEYLKLLDIL